MVTSPRVQRYYLLDLLRGTASLAVLFWHYQHFFYVSPGVFQPGFTSSAQPFFGAFWPLYLYGWTAVQLFYVLSGFVFFFQYSEALAADKIGAWKFFVLRFSRLYPLHFVTLVAVAVLQLLSLRTLGQPTVYPLNDFYHFVLNLLFISHWGLQYGWAFNAPVWSVSIEVLLYIVFFMVASSAKNAVAGAKLATVAAVAGFFGFWFAPGTLCQIATGVFCFYLGGLVWLGLQRLVSNDSGLRSVKIAGVAAAGVLGLSIVGLTTIAPNTPPWLLILFGMSFPGAIMLLAALQQVMPTAGAMMAAVG